MRYFLLGLTLFLAACSSNEKVLRVAATSTPHSEILAHVAPQMKAAGYTLEIITIDDYHLPNRLLAEKKVDANYFQHLPYLEEQKKCFGYDFAVLTKVHIEPLGIYSSKIKSIEEVTPGSIAAIPSDPTNEKRARLLLDSLHLTANLKIKEIDAPLLPRILPDVTIAVIPANFALLAKLKPIALESSSSPYANILVVRRGDEDREDLLALKKFLTSPETASWIQTKYHGAVLSYLNNN